MIVGRSRALSTTLKTFVVVLVTALLTALAVHAASPANADPDLKTVKKKVDALYEVAEAASERSNAANIRLREARVSLKALRADVAGQQASVDTMRDQVAGLLVEQYQGNPLSTASQVVFSADSQAFIDNLSAASSYSSRQGQVIASYDVALQRLKLRKAAARDLVASLVRTQEVLASEKKTIDTKAAQAQALLDTLEEKQRQAMLSGGPVGDLSSYGASGRAGIAVKYALAQVGKAYVWGAAGPGSYDCSGLMLAAWGRAGVGLPHYSQAQMRVGRRVSEGELRPGDLVYYYSPVSHVGMYIGNGLIVNALNPSTGVKVTGLHSMPYAGASRPG